MVNIVRSNIEKNSRAGNECQSPEFWTYIESSALGTLGCTEIESSGTKRRSKTHSIFLTN